MVHFFIWHCDNIFWPAPDFKIRSFRGNTHTRIHSWKFMLTINTLKSLSYVLDCVTLLTTHKSHHNPIFFLFSKMDWAWIANLVNHSMRSWRFRVQIHGSARLLFSSRRPGDTPSLLYKGYQVSLVVVKRPGRGVDIPPTHLAPRLKKKSTGALATPLLCLTTCYEVILTFTSTIE